MPSSSFRMVRLAICSLSRIDSNAIKEVIALQSQVQDGEQNPDEGRGDDPDRDGTPAMLAALATAHGGNRVRRQDETLQRHGLELLEHGAGAIGNVRQLRKQVGEFARAQHRALDAAEGAEIAL